MWVSPHMQGTGLIFASKISEVQRADWTTPAQSTIRTLTISFQNMDPDFIF